MRNHGYKNAKVTSLCLFKTLQPSSIGDIVDHLQKTYIANSSEQWPPY